MNLDNAKFLDYTLYNQDEYAEAVARYQDSYIVDGFEMIANILQPGILFFKGWDLTFDPNTTFTANPIEGQTIYMEMSSILGSVVEGIMTTNYTPGQVNASIKQAGIVSGANIMPLYRYTGGTWVLVANGRIDSINNIKADLSNNITLNGENITISNPYGLDDSIDNVVQDLANEITELTGGGLSQTVADTRYERAISINTNYLSADFAGMNMTQIFDKILTDNLTGYGAATIVGTGGPAIIPTLYDAVNELLMEFYGKTLSGDFGIRLEMPGSKRNGGQLLTISENANGNVFELNYDNYGIDFLNVNADAFRLPSQYVGQIIQKNKWDTVQKREIIMYNGRSFIEDGQSVNLNLGGYTSMAAFEKITLLFERFDTDSFEPLGYGFKQVHQQNFTIAEDGFYKTNTEIFPLSFAVDNPRVATKAWNISSIGVLSGRSLNSSTNRGYVLVAVIGTVTEVAFNGSSPTRVLRNNSFKTIPAKEVDPTARVVIMKDGQAAYDIYDMDAASISLLKDELEKE